MTEKCDRSIVISGIEIKCRKEPHKDALWHAGLQYGRQPVDSKSDIFYIQKTTWRTEKAASDESIERSNQTLNRSTENN